MTYPFPPGEILEIFRRGTVIPAHPLALTDDSKLDELHQRALTRYYVDAGVGGLAIGVHTTEFALHEPERGMYRPVLELAVESARSWVSGSMPVMVAGICGPTEQALREAATARELGYHIGMISLSAFKDGRNLAVLLEHCRRIAEVMPIMGFYLQPAVGGILLEEKFWRELADIPNLVGIKIAPFNRYHTLSVVRGIAESGRDDIALYTGNDDTIVTDLLTRFDIGVKYATGTDHPQQSARIRLGVVGGLLGHWAYWTKRAVELLERLQGVRESDSIASELLTLGAQITESNEAVFDPFNQFRGCISGILYVLARVGLVEAVRTLGEGEELSPGQADRIERIIELYPHLTDDDFVHENLSCWLTP
jgi:dihydrodipicolinate synthase/N-acetylneuraminate lyase